MSDYHYMFNLFYQQLLASNQQPVELAADTLPVHGEPLDPVPSKSATNDFDMIESTSDDELVGLDETEVASNGGESYCETPTSDIWILPGRNEDAGQDSNSISEDADGTKDELFICCLLAALVTFLDYSESFALASE